MIFNSTGYRVGNLLHLFLFSIFGVLVLVSVTFGAPVAGSSTAENYQERRNAVAGLKASDTRVFKHSDIIAFTQGTLEDYRDYGVTFVSWGGYPGRKIDEAIRYENSIKKAMQAGTKIGAKIGARTEFRGFIDIATYEEIMTSRCIDIHKKPLLVPDAKSIVYKGYPAYWFCTNSTAFREYLKNNVKRAMAFQPFGMMMDDPLGTAQAANWAGGCYCKYCIAGFREYLKKKFSKKQLKEMGIDNIDNFDLHDFHMPYAQLPPEKRPLRKEILDFQFASSAMFFHEIMDYARELRGEKIPISGNIDPASRIAGRLFKDVDYFSCEIKLDAAKGLSDSSESLLEFKLADALQRPVAIMGTGADHSFVEEKKLPGLIRCWVAEAYAFGNYFMAPYRLWAYSEKKGSHYYIPDNKSELSPIYNFIKENKDLFDNYEAVTKTGVIHSYAAYRKGSNNIKTIIGELAYQNMPFDILIAGDEIVKIHLHELSINKYSQIILPNDAILDVADQDILKQYESRGGKIIHSLKQLELSSQISLSGKENVRATVRAIPNNPDKPYVVHLLNRDYDLNSDSCNLKTNLTLRIPHHLIGQRKISAVRYARPNSLLPRKLDNQQRLIMEFPRINLEYRVHDGMVEILIPQLDVWGILALETAANN